jgi:LacI family transcriptional regulator
MRGANLSVRVSAVGPIGGTLRDQLSFVLDTVTPPTAVSAENNLIAVQFLHELTNPSLAIPNKMALIAFDDFDAAILVVPPTTVIRQPAAELGGTLKHSSPVTLS